MSPVGHSMLGASIGIVCMPQFKTVRAKAAFLTGFVVLANLPDLAVPGWGHDNYRVSHSLFVNLAMIAAIGGAIGLWGRAGVTIAAAPVILGGAAAWLSHLLLDSFYNHGQGIAIYWPFSRGRLSLPMPWFSTLEGRPPYLNVHSVQVCLVEFAFYFPILALSIYCRRRLFRSPSEKAGKG